MGRKLTARVPWFIPLLVFAAAFAGSVATSSGMDWYQTLSRPWWTPPGSVISVVWISIYVLATLAAMEWWMRARRDEAFDLVAGLLGLNLMLNALWPLVFFRWHFFGASVAVLAALAVTTWWIVGVSWRRVPAAAALLFPYAAWSAFALVLNAAVVEMNAPFLGILAPYALFVHLAGFIIGLGAVTVIDLLGFLARDSRYWTETTVRAHKVTKPLIWAGMLLALAGGAAWHGEWTALSAWQAGIAAVLVANGCYLTFVVSPFLLAREVQGRASDLLPDRLRRRLTCSFLVSALGWWTALARTVASLLP